MSTIQRSWDALGASAAVSDGTARFSTVLSIARSRQGRTSTASPIHSRRPALWVSIVTLISHRSSWDGRAVPADSTAAGGLGGRLVLPAARGQRGAHGGQALGDAAEARLYQRLRLRHVEAPVQRARGGLAKLGRLHGRQARAVQLECLHDELGEGPAVERLAPRHVEEPLRALLAQLHAGRGQIGVVRRAGALVRRGTERATLAAGPDELVDEILLLRLRPVHHAGAQH